MLNFGFSRGGVSFINKSQLLFANKGSFSPTGDMAYSIAGGRHSGGQVPPTYLQGDTVGYGTFIDKAGVASPLVLSGDFTLSFTFTIGNTVTAQIWFGGDNTTEGILFSNGGFIQIWTGGVFYNLFASLLVDTVYHVTLTRNGDTVTTSIPGRNSVNTVIGTQDITFRYMCKWLGDIPRMPQTKMYDVIGDGIDLPMTCIGQEYAPAWVEWSADSTIDRHCKFESFTGNPVIEDPNGKIGSNRVNEDGYSKLVTGDTHGIIGKKGLNPWSNFTDGVTLEFEIIPHFSHNKILFSNGVYNEWGFGISRYAHPDPQYGVGLNVVVYRAGNFSNVLVWDFDSGYVTGEVARVTVHMQHLGSDLYNVTVEINGYTHSSNVTIAYGTPIVADSEGMAFHGAMDATTNRGAHKVIYFKGWQGSELVCHYDASSAYIDPYTELLVLPDLSGKGNDLVEDGYWGSPLVRVPAGFANLQTQYLGPIAADWPWLMRNCVQGAAGATFKTQHRSRSTLDKGAIEVDFIVGVLYSTKVLFNVGGSTTGTYLYIGVRTSYLGGALGSYTWNEIQGGGAVVTGERILLKLEWDGADYILYKNGTPIASGTAATTLAAFGSNIIINGYVSAGYESDSKILAARIYNGDGSIAHEYLCQNGAPATVTGLPYFEVANDLDTTEDFIEVEFLMDNGATDTIFCGTYDGTSVLYIGINGAAQLSAGHGNYNWAQVLDTAALVIGKRYTVKLSWDATVVYFYVNGILKFGAARSGVLPTSSKFAIGALYNPVAPDTYPTTERVLRVTTGKHEWKTQSGYPDATYLQDHVGGNPAFATGFTGSPWALTPVTSADECLALTEGYSEDVTDGNELVDYSQMYQMGDSEFDPDTGICACDGSADFQGVKQDGLTMTTGYTYRVAIEVLEYVSGKIAFASTDAFSAYKNIPVSGAGIIYSEAVKTGTNNLYIVGMTGADRLIGSFRILSFQRVLKGYHYGTSPVEPDLTPPYFYPGDTGCTVGNDNGVVTLTGTDTTTAYTAARFDAMPGYTYKVTGTLIKAPGPTGARLNFGSVAFRNIPEGDFEFTVVAIDTLGLWLSNDYEQFVGAQSIWANLRAERVVNNSGFSTAGSRPDINGYPAFLNSPNQFGYPKGPEFQNLPLIEDYPEPIYPLDLAGNIDDYSFFGTQYALIYSVAQDIETIYSIDLKLGISDSIYIPTIDLSPLIFDTEKVYMR